MGRKSKYFAKELSMEDYDMFFNNPPPHSNDADTHTSALSFHQLTHILNMHGFYKLHRSHRRKENLVEAVSGINKLMSPNRSTLKDTHISAKNAFLSFDQVDADLDALQWQDMSLQTFQSLSFYDDDDDDDDNDSDNDNDNGRSRSGQLMTKNTTASNNSLRPKRGRRPKERKVFDPVFVTKPRSKNKIQKRKSLSQITLTLSPSLP